MELSERMMIERYELGIARENTALRAKSGAAVGSTIVFLAAISVLLTVATIQAFEGWAHAMVIGAIVFTTIGLAIAISPNRRG
jgi:hypothetical protein